MLTPTKTFDHFTQVTPELLKKEGIKGILSDIDDTLVTHNFPLPTPEVEEWVKSLKEAGISLCFISNNNYKRVMPFAKKLGCPFFMLSAKPSPKYLKKALGVLNLDKSEVAFLGDQLYTDIKGGNRFGIKTFKVSPIGIKATLFIKFKRKLEKRHQND